ncbi:hypothetical protein DXG01_008961 [Tephrocybe rancida]|nr:hypothetical protein DXG01_008961 [Tephrocybe rancida]
MHRCLHIQEVIVNIFDYLVGHPVLASDTELARLARTCKTFSGPALDALWHTQPTLSPLLKCFPDDVFALDARRLHWTFKTLPKIEDFERVTFYASRIKKLGCFSPACYVENSVDRVVYSALLSQQLTFNLGPLLPKVRHLIISLNDFIGQAVYARLVIGPNLRTIDLDSASLDDIDDKMPWDNVVAILGEHASTLKNFEYATYSEWDMRHFSPPAVMSLCCSFYSLRTLNIGNLDITHNVLTHISTMPDLTELVFGIVSEELVTFTGTPLMAGEFSKELTVRQCEGDGGDWDLEPFFTTLKTPNLQSFELLKLNNFTEAQAAPAPFTSSMLSRLLQFPYLSHLQITFNLHIKFTDLDLKEMSTAWPRLTSLILPDYTLRNKPTLTFTGLLALTENCKELCVLKIRVDARDLPRFATTGPTVPSRLHNLDLCSSPLSDPEGMIEMIPLCFPELGVLNVAGSYKFRTRNNPPLSSSEKRNSDAWQAVIESLRPLVPSGYHFLGYDAA